MTKPQLPQVRNVAVIAHVDHGKTTLVDALLKQTHVFRDNQEEMGQERILDRNDLERERGITILAKNCAVEYQGVKINIIDTPGHADFSGEVERTLSMADGALLIIDAQEGPMPQTRYVLKMALALGLKVIVVINKIDKKYARPEEAVRRVGDLFLEMASNEKQLDFPVLYSIGRKGVVFTSLPPTLETEGSVKPLLETIVAQVPAPQQVTGQPFKMMVSALDYDPHLGRVVIGKIHQGVTAPGKRIMRGQSPGETREITAVMVAEGLKRVKTDVAYAGDIVALTGMDQATIGDTLAEPGEEGLLTAPIVAEPTLDIILGPNTAPFGGRESRFNTSRQLGERLARELENNVSLRVKPLEGKFKVSGRGELHLAILLETMRREGYEMEVGRPEVIVKEINGVKSEPVEEVTVIVPNEYVGEVTQEMGRRWGKLDKMAPATEAETEFRYELPTRAYLGLRNKLLTATKGTALISSQLLGYQPMGQPLPKMRNGAIVAAVPGVAVEYGLRNLQGRGAALIQLGQAVYEGMIVGINNKEGDIRVNVCKEKNLTNHRTKSHKGITKMAQEVNLTLEQCLDFVADDELLEITPLSLRLRKRDLTELDRKRAGRVVS